MTIRVSASNLGQSGSQRPFYLPVYGGRLFQRTGRGSGFERQSPILQLKMGAPGQYFNANGLLTMRFSPPVAAWELFRISHWKILEKSVSYSRPLQEQVP